MENEIRYYLNTIKACMAEPSEEEKAEGHEAFKPQYIVTAITLPTGAIEIAVNSSNIAEKIDYMLEAYDDEMRLKTNPAVYVSNLMVV